MTAWARKRLEKEEKAAKEAAARLAAEGGPINVSSANSALSKANNNYDGIFDSGIRDEYNSPVVPKSAFHIRNRMLSKMGAKVSMTMAWTSIIMISEVSLFFF